MKGNELIYAVRLRVIAKYLGQILLVLAALQLAPAMFALLYSDYSIFIRSAAVALILFLFGWFLSRIRAEVAVQRNESLVLVALAFILAPAAMSFPMMGTGISFVDAFFESVSGVTTTGLSVAEPLPAKSDIFLLSRAWMQWYGGLGIVTFSLVFVILPGINARRLSLAKENESSKNIVSSTRVHAKRSFFIYAGLTVCAFILMMVTGTPFFSSVIHTLTSVSTGGFSTSDQSLAGLQAPVSSAVILLMSCAGAISFVIYFRSINERSPANFFSAPELKILIILILVTSGLLGIIFHFIAGKEWIRAMLHGASLGISAQTTTGYSTLSIAQIPDAAKVLVIFSMLWGGNLGSTAGGIKLIRLIIIWKVIIAAIRERSMPPHAVHEPRFENKKLLPAEVNDAFLLMLFFIFFNMLSWFIFVLAGQPPLDSLFDIVSATGTVGLSTGVAGPALPAGLKFVLCVNMLLGRLEMTALLLLIYPGTWFGKRRSLS